jgi:Nif-specific regulatory protein
VLLRGESGTGKELVARSIHEQSPRSAGPFVAINCAALSPTLLESELFGHERGAFTGATDRKLGKFELASGGTLMLDELGEMSLEIQAKFLRVLENRVFERVGGGKPIQADVRVVAATNRDLEQAVKDGVFRSDLYFRLRVIELRIPPLRQRREDILPLAEFFLKQFHVRSGHGPSGFSERARVAMQEYSWPGNVRELRNCVERAFVLASGPMAEPEDLALSYLEVPGQDIGPRPVAIPVYHERTLEQVELEHIDATLKHTGGQKNRAAAILGIERSTLDRKLKRGQGNMPAS